ncbi:GNAT family N-acetyltransferase [Rhodospira trueperi]|nr:GNAT family N-acetyltransferase [Rhodospira trueperi]
MRIRPATPDDAPCLPAIERSSGAVFRSLPDLAWVADDDVQSEACHLDLIARGKAWVCVDEDDRPTGFLNGHGVGDVFHILQMAVLHDLQGRGLGVALIEEAKRFSMSRNMRALTLTTFRDVPWNAPFYRRRGFRILDEHELDERLRGILNHEAEAGFPRERRCAMALVSRTWPGASRAYHRWRPIPAWIKRSAMGAAANGIFPSGSQAGS